MTTNDSSDDNSTTLPRRQLGQYLEENRSAAGLKLEDVAPLMQWSTSKLSRIEAGKCPNVRVVDVEALCRIYDIEDEKVMAGLIGLAKQSAGKSWWQTVAYARLSEQAAHVVPRPERRDRGRHADSLAWSRPGLPSVRCARRGGGRSGPLPFRYRTKSPVIRDHSSQL